MSLALPFDARLMPVVLSFGAIGLLAFVALLVVLTNGTMERDVHAMRGGVADVSILAERLTTIASALPGSEDIELRNQRNQELRGLTGQLDVSMASPAMGKVRQDFPSLWRRLEQFQAQAQSLIELRAGSVEAEDRLDTLATMGRDSLGPMLRTAANSLSDEQLALARDRQRLLLIVLVLFFGALIAGAYLTLRPQGWRRETVQDTTVDPAVSDLVEAMEGLDEGIALFDANGALAYCNGRYRGAYATEGNKIDVGIRYEDLLVGLQSEGYFRHAEGAAESWLSSKLEGFHESGRTEKEYLNDGRCLQVSNYRTPGGGVLFLVADVTEAERRDAARQVNDARTRATIETVFDGIVTFNDEGTIEGLNPAAETIFGLKSEEAIGKSIRILMPERLADATDEQIAAFFANQIQRFTGGVHEVEGRRADGGPFPLEIAVKELPDSWSMLERRRTRRRVFIASVRDITERKELADQLQQSQKMEAIGTLAGGIAHDFNNILSVILGYTSLVLDDKAQDDGERENLEMVMQAGRRARDLVEQILTFSRRSDRAKESVALKATVEEVLKLLRSTLPATMEIDQNLSAEPGMVMADSSQIHQVLMNLCTNAAQAMETGDGILTVSLEPSRLDDAAAARLGLQSGPYSRLTVRDTGKGMDRDTADRIFEPFFTTKERGEGTGLGLSVVHGIVSDHGGAITVDSTPGEGTEFQVYLPEIEDTGEAAQEAEAGQSPSGSGRILIVDDEVAVMKMSQQILTRLGYDVVAENDSRRALERFMDDPQGFDLIVTDQTMPGMTGEALIREVRGVRADIPVIVCTGFSSGSTTGRIEDLGVHAVILKPALAEMLGTTVHEALSGQSASA